MFTIAVKYYQGVNACSESKRLSRFVNDDCGKIDVFADK